MGYHSHTVAIPDPNKSSEVTLDGGSDIYVARTYINNLHLNVVLVLDRSGSMEGTSEDTAKTATEEFVRNMRPGDMLGVVGFSDTATPIYPPQQGW